MPESKNKDNNIPKHHYALRKMNTLKNLKKLDSILKNSKNIKTLSKKEMVEKGIASSMEDAQTRLEKMQQELAKVVADYQTIIKGYKEKGWNDTETVFSKEEADEFKKAHADFSKGFKTLIHYVQLYGTKESKQAVTGYKWAANIVNRDVEHLDAFEYNYPVILSTVLYGESIDKSEISRETFKNHYTAISTIAEALNGPKGSHKNSKEYQKFVDSVNNFLKAYEKLSVNEGQISDNHRYHIEEALHKIKTSCEAYIEAKGGVGNQHTQFGKNRMNAAVDMLAVVDTIHKHYPGKNNVDAYYTAVKKTNAPRQVKLDANAMSIKYNQTTLFDYTEEELLELKEDDFLNYEADL